MALNLSYYDLLSMRDRLNDACGTGKALSLPELQDIRAIIEDLARQQAPTPIKRAPVRRVTVWTKSRYVVFHRRGARQVGRQYLASPAQYRCLLHICQVSALDRKVDGPRIHFSL